MGFWEQHATSIAELLGTLVGAGIVYAFTEWRESRRG